MGCSSSKAETQSQGQLPPAKAGATKADDAESQSTQQPPPSEAGGQSADWIHLSPSRLVETFCDSLTSKRESEISQRLFLILYFEDVLQCFLLDPQAGSAWGWQFSKELAYQVGIAIDSFFVSTKLRLQDRLLWSEVIGVGSRKASMPALQTAQGSEVAAAEPAGASAGTAEDVDPAGETGAAIAVGSNNNNNNSSSSSSSSNTSSQSALPERIEIYIPVSNNELSLILNGKIVEEASCCLPATESLSYRDGRIRITMRQISNDMVLKEVYVRALKTLTVREVQILPPPNCNDDASHLLPVGGGGAAGAGGHSPAGRETDDLQVIGHGWVDPIAGTSTGNSCGSSVNYDGLDDVAEAADEEGTNKSETDAGDGSRSQTSSTLYSSMRDFSKRHSATLERAGIRRDHLDFLMDILKKAEKGGDMNEPDQAPVSSRDHSEDGLRLSAPRTKQTSSASADSTSPLGDNSSPSASPSGGFTFGERRTSVVRFAEQQGASASASGNSSATGAAAGTASAGGALGEADAPPALEVTSAEQSTLGPNKEKLQLGDLVGACRCALQPLLPSTGQTPPPCRVWTARTRKLLQDPFTFLPKEMLTEIVGNADIWNYDIFSFQQRAQMRPLFVMSMYYMYKYSLVDKFKLSDSKVRGFFTDVEAHYHPENPYHNSRHAADVLQGTMFLLEIGGHLESLSDIDLLAVIIAAASHDVDHPGLNNAFHSKMMTPLALLYSNQAVLEMHHCATTFALLLKPDNNFFTAMSMDQQTTIRDEIIAMILATDLGRHFELMNKYKGAFGNGSKFKPNTPEEKKLLLTFVIKIADVSNTSKSMDLYAKWADLIMEEFFRQGDREQILSLPVSPFCGRGSSISKCQIGFCDFITQPLVQVLADFDQVRFKYLLETQLENKKYWLVYDAQANAAQEEAKQQQQQELLRRRQQEQQQREKEEKDRALQVQQAPPAEPLARDDLEVPANRSAEEQQPSSTEEKSDPSRP